MPTIKTAEAKEEQAQQLLKEAKEIRALIQAECSHPYSTLKFEYSTPTSYMAGYKTEHTIRIICELCHKVMTARVTEYKD